MPSDRATPREQPVKGPWSHKPRQPVRTYTPEEREEYERERASKLKGAKIAYTIQEACAATGLSRSTIYNLFRSGELSKQRVRGRTLIIAAQLKQLVGGGLDG